MAATNKKPDSKIQSIDKVHTGVAESGKTFEQLNEAAGALTVPDNAPPPAEDLPPELASVLTESTRNALEIQNQLMDVFNTIGANVNANIDRVILVLYHRYKKVYSRSKINSELNKLAEAGMLAKCDGKRATYKLVPQQPA